MYVMCGRFLFGMYGVVYYIAYLGGSGYYKAHDYAKITIARSH